MTSTADHAPADLTGFDVPGLDAIMLRLYGEVMEKRAEIALLHQEIARIRRERDGRLRRDVA